MALCFLLDENVPGPLWDGIQHHNARGVNVLDVLRVGTPPAPPFQTADSDLVQWCEATGRVLVSRDYQTLPGVVMTHIQAGHHIPGLLLFRPHWTIPAVIDALVLYDQLCDPVDLIDQIEYIP